MSGKRAFNNFSQGSLEVMGVKARVGVGTGVQASKTVLKIRYKSSLVYLRILVAVVRTKTTRDFAPKGPKGCLENSNLGDREELDRATKRRSRQGQL